MDKATELAGSRVTGIAAEAGRRMRVNEVRDVLRRQPFEPFRIQMTNGESYVVRHPEFAAVTLTSIIVGTPLGKDGIPDRFVQCDLLHVVAIEPGNGKKRRSPRKPRKK